MILVIIILGAGAAFYYFESTGTIDGLNQTVSSQQTLISSQRSQLTADQNKVANLTATISSLRSQVSSLQAQVNVDNAKISALEHSGAQANATIASLESQISSLNTNVSALNAQISALNGQIATLNGQLAYEEQAVAQLESVLGLVDLALASSQSQAITTGEIISVTAGTQATKVFTTAATGGYLLVGIQASTSNHTTLALRFGDPLSVGSNGVGAFVLAGSTTYTLEVYDYFNSSFSATLSVWYFHN